MLPPVNRCGEKQAGEAWESGGRSGSAEILCGGEGHQGDSDTMLGGEVEDGRRSEGQESALGQQVTQMEESRTGRNDGAVRENNGGSDDSGVVQWGDGVWFTPLTAELMDIYQRVCVGGGYNFQGAKKRVPSVLRIEEWKRHLEG